MRIGVGEGLGEGVGVGVCALAGKGNPEIVRPAAPAAGSSFTKVRRLIADPLRGLRFDLFIEVLRSTNSPVGTRCF
jgi:hypothetical protein